MDQKMEAETSELLPRLSSVSSTRAKSVEAETSEMLPRVSSISSTRATSLEDAPLAVSRSNSLVPVPQRSFLQSRTDHQEMLEWQEGGGEAADLESQALVRAPSVTKFEHETICGVDKRPFYPAVLFASLLWSLCMTQLQGRVLTEAFGSAHSVVFFLVLYVVTISAAVWTARSDPGQVSEESLRKIEARDLELPKRAHKHWLYARPVLRFHQYCRWVTNSIGLRNHRTYMVMLAGFVTIAISDAFVDLVLLLVNFKPDRWGSEAALFAHLAYSIYFAWYATPLLRMHSSFICRNELAHEWKKDYFYIVYDESTGAAIPVNDLDVDTYNRHFDENSFVYDSSLNPFDKGWKSNCFAFWFNSRAEGELGEF